MREQRHVRDGAAAAGKMPHAKPETYVDGSRGNHPEKQKKLQLIIFFINLKP